MDEQPEKAVRQAEPVIKSPLLGWLVLAAMVAAVFAVASLIV